MANPKWKDTTNYYQSDKERLPTTYSVKTSGLNITVTYGHIFHKGEWIMHCHQLGIECRSLASDSLGEAKDSAIHVVKETLAQLMCEINSIV